MDWKKKTRIVGAIIGIATGIIVAQVMISNAEEKNETVQLNAKNGAKIGMAVLNMAKQLG